MGRNGPDLDAAINEIRTLHEAFWQDLRIPGKAEDLNQELEKANRVADFFELGELMCLDARIREESCGGHFREEHQTEDGEALRDDSRFCHVAVWEYAGEGKPSVRHQEALHFEAVPLTQRSYK